MSATPDLARAASAFADPRRVRVLMALADGRALPAGRLAEEAGVAASTVSAHLALLLDLGLVVVVPQGRHRYYRLANGDVEGVLEALARIAPKTPITSLREHTRTEALRTARTCYHHLAGRFGVDLFRHLIDSGCVVGGDGVHHPDDPMDQLSAPGRSDRYRLTPSGVSTLTGWGVPHAALTTTIPLRYCVDWTEQAHHLSGPLGTAIATRFFEAGWIERGRVPRSIRVTDRGRDALAEFLGAAHTARSA
ncbi:metalloregulator ArsR/SmtB family transcription factor [Humibacter antri]